MASPQMYDTGLENLKKAALTVRVRSFLSQNGEIDPADLENPELSLDLQSLIDDPNFEVGEGLFPELLHNHEKQNGKAEYSQLTTRNGHQNGHGVNGFNRNPLAYMPQPVHGGSSFNNNNNNNNDPNVLVKEEPMDHRRIDFNANAVSSTDPNPYSNYSNTLSNVTSPSSSSGSSQGYSPNAYIHHHLTPATIPSGNDGLNGKGSLSFNGKGLHHHHLSSKKVKNVDKGSDEYKRRRERNNIAVRKSREKAKLRSRETEERVKILAKENDRLQKKIDLLTEELTFLRSFFSNVGGLPEQIHREFNKHLETFQHHHIQNGIHLQ
ncbi:unnamed protein product [Allacma fusca]|uniref:BZIP domain-containing protein n=1 Tax=Allacma fusca TaxID=39272 RepID=A0A8J2NKG3_9HEXA|nr:unnamed protein product [Allacma fusca]